MNIFKFLPHVDSSIHSLALLVFRVAVGGLMFFGHGLGKLSQIGTDAASRFPDPIGVGSQVSHLLASLSEGVGGLLLMFGLFTRLSSLAQAFTMFVAAFVIHMNDPLFPKRFSGVVSEYAFVSGPSKELAIMYLLCFFLVFITGPGRYSLDRLFFKK